jgi:predicted nucleic acid-binding Zn ribbon protein
MATTNCSECGREHSGPNAVCSRCARPAVRDADRARRFLLPAYSIGCLIVLALLTILLAYRIFVGMT